MTTEFETATKKTKKKDKSAKKKRKISKHMLQANKDQEDLQKARASETLPIDENAVDSVAASALTKVSKKSRPDKTPPGTANTHTKDVKEAAGYLTNWKKFRAQWKFNKNTQSWLIRHMYESDKVAKASFMLLLEYLQGLKGDGAKERIIEEATRRALRYKEFEEGGGSDNKQEEKKTSIKFAEDTKEAAPSGDEDGKGKKQKKPDPTASEEHNRWSALDAHEKRKEYKRARKILETVKIE